MSYGPNWRTRSRQFNAYPQHWHRNQDDATTLRTVPATSNTPDGDQHPGVALMVAQGVRLVLTTTQALKLANDIADTIEEMEKTA